MITELTEQQERELEEHYQKWLGVGLSCESADRSQTEANITELYLLMGLASPKFVWHDSPATIRDKYPSSDLLGDVILDELWAGLYEQFQKGVGDRLWKLLWHQLWDQLWDRLREVSRNGLETAPYMAAWAAVYTFAVRIGVEFKTKDMRALSCWDNVAQSTFGWMLYDNVCLVIDRPQEIYMVNDLLHNADGMSVKFRDGWGIYSWHGVTVPESYITGTATVDEILGEEDVEVRRCGIETYGPNFMQDAGGAAASTDEFGTLWLLNTSGEQIVAIVVTNTTPEPDGSHKEYLILVPPGTQTSLEGVAWTARMSPEQYRLSLHSES